MIGKRLKDQRGLTLVELLAVVVILGIIAAIAVPSIGNIIENSKKDTHIANAQQLQNAAKLYFAETPTKTSATLEELKTAGFMDDIVDPSDKTKTYEAGTTKIDYSNKKYLVTIIGTKTYINNKEVKLLKRIDVKL
ncbi:prepilin-type N-terminal cleavage/methylation domain-containing protein [Cytobacillus depressus]|uniref:Prepilin-type N-terminal cleavage/methylation domain-containing protein n=1 Tax=Cytobacillus depressus TaxID=1602942 RepID=A0A6L3VBE6_9BACI|nr:prepilin-type N-terminal cleavage/methylation domain-containing protein [Cytobacillus depressus]